MRILSYDFEGPWLLGQIFNDVPGIYVVFTSQNWLDVGETDKLGSRINGENHERKSQWILNSNRLPIRIAFLNVPNSQTRLLIEAQLRNSLCPLCGER